MKLLVDAVAATTGGGLSRTQELVRTLPVLRPDYRFVFSARRAVAGLLRDIDPSVELISPGRLVQGTPARVGWQLVALPLRARRSTPPDVVLGPFNVAPVDWPSPRPFVAVIVSSLLPYAVEARSMYGGREALRLRALRALTDRTLSRADRVFVLSEQAFSLIDRGLLEGKTELIPMAPPQVGDMSFNQPGPGDPYVLIVGDLFRYKGVETAIRALASLPAPGPLLLIAGRPTERSYVRELADLSSALGVADRVRFLGSRPHDEVLGLMAGSLCCIVPSRFENLSHVPLEAMAVGTPVIASDIPGSREACGDAAAYFPLLDSGRLADTIQRVATDRELRDQLVRAGRARASGQAATSASDLMLRSIEAR